MSAPRKRLGTPDVPVRRIRSKMAPIYRYSMYLESQLRSNPTMRLVELRKQLYADTGVRCSEAEMATWHAARARVTTDATMPRPSNAQSSLSTSTITGLADLSAHSEFLKTVLSAEPNLGRPGLCKRLQAEKGVTCNDWWMRK